MDYSLRRGEFCGGGLHFFLLRKNASTSITAALTESGERIDGEFWGERVAVWRDPRDRLLSVFRHYERGLKLDGVPPNLSLERFCAVKSDDWHLQPQWPVLRTCDRVLRFDRLHEDFERLRRDYPWVGELPHLNAREEKP